jgi:hypothetical protein
MKLPRIRLLALAASLAAVAALVLAPAAQASITGPFTYGGVTMCPSYHDYFTGCNGIDTVPSPPYSVKFDPAQDTLPGSKIKLTMNATGTVSGAWNTFNEQRWSPPFTLTENATIACNSSGQIEDWPAIWTVGTVGTWPAGGEEDVFEGLGGKATWSFHYVNSGGVADDRGGTPAGNWCGTHTFEMHVTTSAVTYTWDGTQVANITAASIELATIPADQVYAINDLGALDGTGGPTVPNSVFQVNSLSVVTH